MRDFFFSQVSLPLFGETIVITRPGLQKKNPATPLDGGTVLRSILEN